MAISKRSYYIRKQLEKLSAKEKDRQIKKLTEDELIGDMRKWALGAVRDREEGREYETFPIEFVERMELFKC